MPVLFSGRPLPEGLGELAEVALAPVHRRHDPLLEGALSSLLPAHPRDRASLEDVRARVRDYLLDAVVAALVAGYNAGVAAAATCSAAGRVGAQTARDPG